MVAGERGFPVGRGLIYRRGKEDTQRGGFWRHTKSFGGKGIQTGALYSTAAIEAEEGVAPATVAQVAR